MALLWGAIAGPLRRLWPYIAIVLLVFLSIALARRIGGLETAIGQQLDVIKRQKEMSNAANRVPVGRDDILARLRDGGL